MPSGNGATASAIAELQDIDLVDHGSQLVLRAVSQTGGTPAVEAFKAWRALSTLEDADYKHHQAMPLLAGVALREKIDDPGVARMRGVRRHLWAKNTLKLDLLFKALDALNSRDIAPLLLSGAALFARAPEMINQRAIGELELSIHPDQFKAAGEALAVHGFTSKGLALVTVGQASAGIPVADISVTHAGHPGEISIGCDPTPNITNLAVHEALWQGSELRTLRDRSVRVPMVTHHLFCAMAHCEPWNRIECFSRLLEGTFLLSTAGMEVDWDEMAGLVGQFGMQEYARSYFAVLVRDTAHMIPNAFFEETAKQRTAAARDEWRIRALHPRVRSKRQRRFLVAQNYLHHRSRHPMAPVSFSEALLRFALHAIIPMWLFWILANRRLLFRTDNIPHYAVECSPLPARILQKQGQWAIMMLPLTEAPSNGASVSLTLEPLATGPDLDVIIAGGCAPVRCKIISGARYEMEVYARPLVKFGGNGLLLFHMRECGASWRSFLPAGPEDLSGRLSSRSR